jgi:hypothetical protein
MMVAEGISLVDARPSLKPRLRGEKTLPLRTSLTILIVSFHLVQSYLVARAKRLLRSLAACRTASSLHNLPEDTKSPCRFICVRILFRKKSNNRKKDFNLAQPKVVLSDVHRRSEAMSSFLPINL